jgi:hypothetical protein
MVKEITSRLNQWLTYAGSNLAAGSISCALLYPLIKLLQN